MSTKLLTADFDDIQQQLRMAESLRQVASVLNASLDRDTVFATIAEQLQKLIGYDRACILLYDQGQLHTVYASGEFAAEVLGSSFAVENSLGGRVFATQTTLIVPDVQHEPNWYPEPGTESVRAWMGVPLLIKKKAIGVLSLDSHTPHTYQPANISAMQAFADQAAIAIENVRLYEAERNARHTAEILRQANIALTQSLAQPDILQILLDYLAQLVPYDSANVFLLQDKHFAAPVALRHYEQWTADVEQVKKVRFDVRTNPSFRAIFIEGKPLIVNDVATYPNWEIRPESHHTRAWLGVPLIVGGQVIGCFSLDKTETNFFTTTHLQLAEMLALQAAVSIQNAQLLEKTQTSAHELKIAGQILQLLNATPTVTDAFPQIARILKAMTNGERISLTTLDAQKEWATMLILDQPTAVTALSEGAKFPLTITAAAKNVLAGKVNITPDMSQEIEFPAERMLYEAGHHSRINVPLMVGRDVLGALNIIWNYKNGFDIALLPLMEQIASGIALALERARLFTESQQQARQLAILNQLGRQLTGLINTADLCNLVTQTLVTELGYASAGVLFSNPKTEMLTVQAIEGPHKEYVLHKHYQQSYHEGLIGLAARTGQLVLANKTAQHPDFLPSDRMKIAAELALPLKLGDQLIGVLNVDSERPDVFTDNDVATLTIVADQLAIAIEKARLFEATERHTNELEVIIDIAMALRESQTTAVMIPIVLSKATRAVNGVASHLYLREPESNQLSLRGSYPSQTEPLATPLIAEEEICMTVLQTGQVYISPDWDETADSPPPPPALRSKIVLPLRAQAQTIGVMDIALPDTRPFTDEEVRLLTAVAEIAGTSLERAQLLETLEQRVIERTRALEEANQQLKELDHLKSKFVSDVSHELRTPITNLVLYLDLMTRGKAERQAHYLDILRRQAQRLTNLIEDILNLSRLEIGGQTAEMSPVDLNEIIQQVTTTYQPRLEEDGLQLHLDLMADLPLLLGERNQLTQVITNLLANAINYTPAGSITITTRNDTTNNTICLLVSDTGIGIPSKDQPFLFDRFYRGQQVAQSNIPGTGLGLAIVHEIVKLHHGTIDVTSKIDVGTTFRICLPAEK